MGLALVLLLSFASIVGVCEKHAQSHHKPLITKAFKKPASQKITFKKKHNFKPIIARLDGIEIRSLKG